MCFKIIVFWPTVKTAPVWSKSNHLYLDSVSNRKTCACTFANNFFPRANFQNLSREQFYKVFGLLKPFEAILYLSYCKKYFLSKKFWKLATSRNDGNLANVISLLCIQSMSFLDKIILPCVSAHFLHLSRFHKVLPFGARIWLHTRTTLGYVWPVHALLLIICFPEQISKISHVGSFISLLAF